MNETHVVAEPMNLEPPDGLQQILAVFGNIHEFIGPDGILDSKWHTSFLDRAVLPFPLELSWDHSKTVTHMLCHKRLARTFEDVFGKIRAEGLQSKIVSFGGCFGFRTQRTGTRLSTHCWGIAVDLNPETNIQGTAGDIDKVVVEIFRSAGFKWGGEWPGARRDPMHFQFCTGY